MIESKEETTQASTKSRGEVLASLSGKETRAMVTPYAFTVSEDLLGQPLAGPFRRGFAMIFDLLCIGILTSLNVLIFTLLVSLTFFKASTHTKQTWLRTAIRSFAILLLIIALFFLLDSFNYSSQNHDDKGLAFKDPKLSAIVLNTLLTASCESDIECYLQEAQTLGVAARDSSMDADYASLVNILQENLANKSWSDAHKQQFIDEFSIGYNTPDAKLGTVEGTRSNTADFQASTLEDDEDEKEDIGERRSLLSHAERLAEEFGLSLGWAALYFSVFTAWMKGQTPGKKLFGIEVVGLDGKHLSLWEAFGRYGGYAAGFSTGLMGFVQVFWDPNRQAIQDKISETLVIRSHAAKIIL